MMGLEWEIARLEEEALSEEQARASEKDYQEYIEEILV